MHETINEKASSQSAADLMEESTLPNSMTERGAPVEPTTLEADPEKTTCVVTEDPNLEGRGHKVSTDAHGNTYPEGGARAWLVVFGSFCSFFSAFELMNTLGTYQAWISTHQLKNYTPGSIGWIFGTYNAVTFLAGIQVGPIFDLKGPTALISAGSVLLVITHILLGFCTTYWSFMLVFGVLGGLSTSLMFTPAVASVQHWFYRRRGLATGIGISGGSLAGIIFPFMMQALFPTIGFAWTTRAIALIVGVFAIIASLLTRSRLHDRSARASLKSILPDFTIFRDPAFAVMTAGIYCVEWGLFIPLSYISSYALARGMSEAWAYRVLAILNVGSLVGRWIPGYLADRIGRMNTLILAIILCLVSVLAIWLPGATFPFAVLFGIASGSNISLTPVCLAQLCRIEHYGRYYSTAYTIASIGALTGIPIAGSILDSCGGEYWGLIIFCGCSYAAGLACFVTVRVIRVGWHPLAKF